MFEIPKFDVFMSYANENRALAQMFHRLLVGKGFISSFEDFDSSNKNSRDKIFKAIRDSAVCVLIIGPRKQSPWWDDHICEAIGERVSSSHGEYRVVSILFSSTPQRYFHDLSFQTGWGFQSEGSIYYSDVTDDAEKVHELIRLIRGADRQPSLLANPETRKWATMRAKNALDVDWKKLYSGQQSQSKSQSAQFQSLKIKECPEPIEWRKRFHENAEKYRKMLVGFVVRRMHDPELAQEIAQKTMVNYLSLREADNWQQDFKNEKAYLIKMARNLLMDEWRAQSKTKSVSLDHLPDDLLCKDLSKLTRFDVEKFYLEELSQTIPLNTVLGRLSERQMELLNLRVVYELTYEQIAQKVNENPMIVRYEVQRILVMVRARAKKLFGNKNLFKSDT
jgi:RNA polymerase sigma factor (sigma-70 family)